MSAPNREVFKNDAETTLNGAISDSATSIVVDDGSVFPSTGNFRLLCEGEIMHCTARSGNTLTVNRGIENTTAAAHSSGVTIAHILTSEAMLRTGQDNVPMWGSTNVPALGIYDANGNIIDSSDFTVVNQNSTTITDDFGSIHLRKPANAVSTENCTLLVRSAPSVPFTVKMAMTYRAGISQTTEHIEGGLVIRESSTGKFILFGIDHFTQSSVWKKTLAAYRFNSATSYALAASISPTFVDLPTLLWLKIEVTADNVIYSISVDGAEWWQIHSEVDTAFLTGTIDQIGFGCNVTSSNYQLLMRVLHFSVA